MDYGALTSEQLRELGIDAHRRERRAWRPGSRRWWRHVWHAAEYEVARRDLAARPEGAPPNKEQRSFLELLDARGVQTDNELADVVDFEDPVVGAAISDADARGWIKVSLAIGGIGSPPPTWYELTPLGRAVVVR
jgi:hypothetical protein